MMAYSHLISHWSSVSGSTGSGDGAVMSPALQRRARLRLSVPQQAISGQIMKEKTEKVSPHK